MRNKPNFVEKNTKIIVFVMFLRFFIVIGLLSFSLRAQTVDTTNLLLRLNSDSVLLQGSHIIKWYDQSNKHVILDQIDTSSQPNVGMADSLLNNRSGIHFDGVNDYMRGSFNSTVSNNLITLYFVQKVISPPIGHASIVLNNNVNSNDYGSSDNLIAYLNINNSPTVFRNGDYSTYSNSFKNYPAIYKVIFDGLVMKLYENDVLVNTISSSGNFNFDNLIVGSRWYGGASKDPTDCEIYEIIMYDSLLSLTEQRNVMTYLRNKYAPSVNLGVDLSLTTFCNYTLDASNRFVNYHWSTGDTTKTISVNKTGTYWVTVKDVFGFTSQDTIQVNYPEINIPTVSTILCSGDSKTWNTLFSKQDYTFQWQDNSADSVLSINSGGQYWVKITDSLGCFNYSDTIAITLDNFPSIASLGNDTSLCSGNSIYLKSGASLATNYLWSDGSTAASLTITTTGQYWVTASDANCSKKDTINVTIAGNAPTVNFSNTVTCFGNTTTFTDLSTPPGGNTIVSWLWDFGESSSGVNDTSALQNPVHIYADTGSYTVKLLVTTNVGCGALISKTVKIYPYPQINFTTNNLCEDAGTKFTDQSTAFGYPITQWSWSFGDPSSGTNNVSTLQNPVHTYINSGTYSVQLIGQNSYGCIDTSIKNIIVKQLPVADFNYSLACKNSSVQFTDNSALPPSTSIQNSYWNFGGNSTSSLINPKHTFISNVSYNVTHIVTATNGCIDTITKPVVVHPSPNTYFSYGNACINSSVSFSDLSVVSGGTITGWLWSFGNTTSALQNSQYAFSSLGNTNVKLVVTTNQGCKDSTTKTIVVHPNPVPNFTYNPGFGNPPVTVNFTNTSTGALSYIWDFDDGTQSALANPSHNYLSSDNYQISLKARNNFGCEKTIIKTFDVFEQYLDVAILDITTSLQNNFLSITAKIANTGNTDVTDMEFYIKVKNGPALKENWSGVFQASSIISYKLSSSAYIENEKDYVCVSVLKPNGIDDQVSSNNELCKALDESEFKVLDIYPNPSTDMLTIPFIIPASENLLTITIYNVNGEIVKNAFSDYLSNGLQMLIINTVELTSGFYACKIEYENQTVIKTFIKH